jgi:hypothetical protein
VRRALALLVAACAACAADAPPKSVAMECDNPDNPKDRPSFVIDNVEGRVVGAVQMWNFSAAKIEWLDDKGYTYSFDPQTRQLHRVYPRLNVGYLFDCHATRQTY